MIRYDKYVAQLDFRALYSLSDQSDHHQGAWEACDALGQLWSGSASLVLKKKSEPMDGISWKMMRVNHIVLMILWSWFHDHFPMMLRLTLSGQLWITTLCEQNCGDTSCVMAMAIKQNLHLRRPHLIQNPELLHRLSIQDPWKTLKMMVPNESKW